MQLPGRLAASTLGDLLGALHRERITGQLELLERKGPRGGGIPGRRHRIHLCRGLITAVETELSVTPLGEILRREGLVGDGAIGWALRRIQDGDARPAGEILVDGGLARPEFIRAGLRKQLKQRVDALFSIEDAAVAFHSACTVEAPPAKASPLWPSDFLHGRPRLRDRDKMPPSSARPPSSAPSSAGPRSTPWPPQSHRRRPEAAPASHARPHEAPRCAPIEDERARARRLLGLPEGSGLAEVRRAFRKLAAELHPDRYTAASPSEQRRNALRFARISAAYHLLVA